MKKTPTAIIGGKIEINLTSNFRNLVIIVISAKEQEN